ncbi:MAG TPA: SRPBCC family protein [Steroidobacteraceae bacterium]|jgi:hypothetical protein
MRIQSTLTVAQTRGDVWKFLADPQNAPKWDRSVASVVVHSPSEVGVGTEVETTAPSGMRQRFRIVEFSPARRLRFILLKSSIFKTAELVFLLESIPGGTRITHEINFTFRFYAMPLYVVIMLTNRKALSTDLGFLGRALQANANQS